jgi:CBS domain-containing protein
MKTAERLLALTAVDVMEIAPVTIPRGTPLQAAAGMLRRGEASEAPVVDEGGRCVGILSAADFLRWVEEGCPDVSPTPSRTCAFQTEGRLLTGEEAVICTQPPGACPLQAMRPTTAGRHTAICLQPCGVLCDWQQTNDGLPDGGVAGRYASSDAVTAVPSTPLRELGAMMADSHQSRLFILDDQGRPVGVVSATDILEAFAWEGWLEEDGDPK